MASIVPPSLLNLAGLAALPTEPHVQTGNHLRIAHHPVFGLPVAPFILQRAAGRATALLQPRRDAIFRNKAGQVLSLPITLQKGDEIRASIPQGLGVTCIWSGITTAEPPRRIPVRDVNVLNPTRSIDAPRIDPKVFVDFIAGRDTLAVRATSLRLRAYGASAGPAPALLGERRAAPYAVAAPGIAELVITGTGTIQDLAWIAAQDLERQEWETIAVLNLPHVEGHRYLSVSDARTRAEAALRAQAPRRRPLQETSGATPAASAAGFSDAEESDRVHALASALDGDLDALIDGATPPLQSVEDLPLTGASGQPLAQDPGDVSSISISHLARVLQGSLDPGVAAWLGYKGFDADFAGNTGISLYRVVGYFRNPTALGASAEQLTGVPLGAIPQSERSLSEGAVFKLVSTLAAPVLLAENRRIQGALDPAGDYLTMAAVALVDRRSPTDAPRPPVMLPPEHIAWLPETPPGARREVDCPLSGVLTGALLAAERQQPPGSFASLNRRTASGAWHLPLTLGIDSTESGALLDDLGGRQGFVSDRSAGADAASYHIAQSDRFGRWSDFAQGDAAPGPRPKPPRPVLQGNYRQPAPADAGTLGGTLALRVPLPEADALAPGSYPLSYLRFSFRHHPEGDPGTVATMPDLTAAASTAISIDTPPAGEAPRRAVPLNAPGPVLARCEQRRMIVTAVWVDSAGQESVPSEPLRLLMTDPRPPAQLSIPDVLLYAARPDATGLSWIERAWPAAAGAPGYAVYYTDEVRLISWLNDAGRTGEAQTIAATKDRAARAGKLRAIQGDFPDALFERLNGAVTSPAPGQMRFRHAVSGSSRVLNGYRIAVEAPASGARPDLSALDLVFYGVPNADPPPRPVIDLRMGTPATGEPALVAEVTVTVRPGVTQAQTARLYRTRGGPADPLYAPVVASLPLPAPDATGRQIVTFRDIGSALIAPAARLAAYARYQWFADVQGPPESGSSVPGLWSQPSDPKGMATVPPDVPVAPTASVAGTAVAGGLTDLRVSVDHPLGLAPTVVGAWRYDLYRAAPGEAFGNFVSGEVRAVPLAIADPQPAQVTVLGTRFRLVLTDPAGRMLPAVELVVS